ncbi:hypothetical protein V3C99_014241 [Haemonchus contortus]
MSSNYYAVNASDLIHDVIGEAFRAAKLDNYTRALANMDKPEPWQTWTLGMLIISACSFSAPLGMLILPCLSKALYERIMIFLIALGIGALSGSSMFIMLPQAFHLTQLNDFNYHSKAMIVVGALYVFFTVDRILQYGLELRRRRQAKRKVHTSTIVSIMSTSPTLKPRSGTVTTSDSTPSRKTTENSESPGGRRTEVQEKEKAELAEEVEIAMLNNAFARTFSTRRRLAVMNSIDGIELRDPRRRGSLGANVVRNSFVQTVNNEISRNQDHFLDVVHTDVSRAISGSKRPSLSDPPIPLSSKKSDDEVSVSVKIVEKHVIDPSTIEVASVAYMIIFGSSANNFVDGMSMGAAFSDSLLRGLSIGAAVVSQQFPQELGTLAILINSGLGFRRTMLYNMIPILLSYFGFICGVLLDNVDEDYDEFIFSISSGMYLYIFLGTLIPEIREGCNELMKVNMRESLLVTLLQYLGITSGICFMYYMSTVGEVEL